MRTAIGLIIIVGVLIVIVSLLWRRRTRDEIHSIDHYRNALETLHGMRPESGSTSVRVLDPDEAKNLRQPHALPVIRSSDRLYPPPVIGIPPEAQEGMVFDDSQADGQLSPEAEHHRNHDSSEWAISRAQSHPPLQNRQWMAMGIATAIVLVLLIVGVLIGRSSHNSAKSVVTTTPTTHKRAKQATTTTTPKVTPTTTPSTYQPLPGASATAATYAAPGTRYVLAITAAGGGCWTVATSQPGNAQLFVGTISPGTPQQITVTGGAQVTLGAPGNVTVTLNGRPVVFPTGFQTPLVLTFQPATASTTTTTATSAVTTTTVASTTTSATTKP